MLTKMLAQRYVEAFVESAWKQKEGLTRLRPWPTIPRSEGLQWWAGGGGGERRADSDQRRRRREHPECVYLPASAPISPFFLF